ncbi:Hypothetical predicted protein [Lecanosticta acicola]|uniref:Uncharacterized protein n=1 Tax=Lecanosticta acicola TaxID=111012 RepID=A0AAI8Z9K7_9PEZI|nr:Hypothetical predicted protein [Lecanosticta acicola]
MVPSRVLSLCNRQQYNAITRNEVPVTTLWLTLTETERRSRCGAGSGWWSVLRLRDNATGWASPHLLALVQEDVDISGDERSSSEEGDRDHDDNDHGARSSSSSPASQIQARDSSNPSQGSSSNAHRGLRSLILPSNQRAGQQNFSPPLPPRLPTSAQGDRQGRRSMQRVRRSTGSRDLRSMAAATEGEWDSGEEVEYPALPSYFP